MILEVLGSSSAGNGYILQNDTEALLIECGVPFSRVKQAVGFKINKIAGCLISHEHGDHSRHVNDVLKAMVKVYASSGTIGSLPLKNGNYPIAMTSGKKISIGNFTVLPFDVKHDCAEPFGFLIHHEEMGNVLFATDTYYLPYRFEGLNNILIECNYRKDLLDSNVKAGRIPGVLLERTLESHMSFDTCLEALNANDLTKVNNIVLIHLSSGNSNEFEFQRDIHLATGKNVHVADKGLKINFNKTPF